MSLFDPALQNSNDATPQIALDGGRKTRKNLTQSRIWFSIAVLILAFLIVAGRLVQIGLDKPENPDFLRASHELALTRPQLVDRNGEALALDIQAPSLYAEPRNIIDLDEAFEALHRELPNLDADWLRDRLDGDEGFVWLERELSPAAQERIFNLGIPGVDFVMETKRFYPGGETAAHILGAVNIDNEGIMGVERYLDRNVLNQDNEAPEQIALSIDIRVQYALHAELVDAMERYQAIAAAGVILDVQTGETIGLVSLPDFDPNEPATALEEGRINRITAGTFELGSTFKVVTFSGALDSGVVSLTDSFDATQAVQFGRYRIGDFHGKNRVLSVPEIFKYSSNIGTIRMMQTWGKDNYRSFLNKVGFDDALSIELPETKRSTIAAEFSEVAAATASFGHGLSITPMHMAQAVAGFVNNGTMHPATLFARTPEQAQEVATQIISPLASEYIRYLLRLNAIEGSGSRMNRISDGYLVGGKTGTAEKVVDGRYASDKNLNVFASAFPMSNPRYAMVILVDEPQRENPQTGVTAGWNAGEVTGRIVKRIAPFLGVTPDFSEQTEVALVPSLLQNLSN